MTIGIYGNEDEIYYTLEELNKINPEAYSTIIEEEFSYYFELGRYADIVEEYEEDELVECLITKDLEFLRNTGYVYDKEGNAFWIK